LDLHRQRRAVRGDDVATGRPIAAILVDERLRDPAALRDLLHRRATKTVLLELALGHIEDPLLALGAREPAPR
jgi:hypothetical protein